MSFIPDRRAAFIRSNVTADAPGDPYLQNFWYKQDPAKWVVESYATARALAFKIVRFMMPNGDEREGFSSSRPFKAGVFRDQAAEDAFVEQCPKAKAAGISTHIYTGRIMPDGSSVDPRKRGTQDFFKRQLAPYIGAGLERIDFDNSSVENAKPGLLEMALQARTYGLTGGVGGEAYPFVEVAGGIQALQSSALHACGWMALEAFITGNLGGGIPKVNPITTELRVLFDGAAFTSAPSAGISRVREFRSSGLVVDLFDARDSNNRFVGNRLVVDAILAD